jgi:ABC-type ATPase involved in cell division
MLALVDRRTDQPFSGATVGGEQQRVAIARAIAKQPDTCRVMSPRRSTAKPASCAAGHRAGQLELGTTTAVITTRSSARWRIGFCTWLTA